MDVLTPKDCCTYCGLPWFWMNSCTVLFFLKSVKQDTGIQIGTPSNLWINFGSAAIFTILLLLIQKRMGLSII